MSARMTTIHLEGSPGAGYSVYGRCDAETMIKSIRHYAHRQMELAQQILAASDHDFRIYTHVGSIVQRKKEILQAGRK